MLAKEYLKHILTHENGNIRKDNLANEIDINGALDYITNDIQPSVFTWGYDHKVGFYTGRLILYDGLFAILNPTLHNSFNDPKTFITYKVNWHVNHCVLTGGCGPYDSMCHASSERLYALAIIYHSIPTDPEDGPEPKTRLELIDRS